MLAINWQLALIVLAVMPVLIGVALWFRQKIVHQFRIARRINSIITERAERKHHRRARGQER